MGKLSEVEKKWVDDFLGNRSGGGVNSAFTNDGRVEARVGVTIVDIDDLKGNPNIKPESPDLQLPKRAQMVKLFDLDKNTESDLTADQVKAIKKSPDFIDNFKELKAQPDWMTLEIVKIEFIYASGKKFDVLMDSVNHGLNHSAQFYCLKGGIYYPCDADKRPLIDAINAPAVVGGKEWIDKEIARRKQEREEIAWIVYAFAGAVASLGGAAGGGKGGGVRKAPPMRRGGPPKPTVGGGGGGRGGGTGTGSKTPPAKPAQAYPGRRAPTQDAIPPRALPDSDMRRGSQQATRDMQRGHTDPKGVWDQSAFDKNPALKKNLDGFAAAKNPGDKGFSVKNLDVANKKPEKLHQELQAAGFEYRREPLVAFTEKNGTKHYRLRQKRWEVNGKPVREGTPDAVEVTTTKNKNDKDIVPHDIYLHPDGGLVRIKPEGDPNGRRPRPQVSKSVVNDPKAGTDFDNEMFKVTNDGKSVPKLPGADWGMKQAPRGSTGGNENAGYVDTVMTAAHPDLAF